ncbi:hypothetical protein LP419_23460 [Massilia sp. H-1]|nr:hypothetical protein LP419_23460 [Massilia sp. H-1]
MSCLSPVGRQEPGQTRCPVASERAPLCFPEPQPAPVSDRRGDLDTRGRCRAPAWPPARRAELRYLGADHGPIPGLTVLRPYTEAGLLRLLTTRTATRHATHELIRFKHWLEKEAFPNLRRFPSSST